MFDENEELEKENEVQANVTDGEIVEVEEKEARSESPSEEEVKTETYSEEEESEEGHEPEPPALHSFMGIPLPEDEEVRQTVEDAKDVTFAYLRNESPIVAPAYSAVRRAWHEVEDFFTKEKSEDFDLETAMEEAGISGEDASLFTGVKTQSEFDYRIDAINQERDDKDLLDAAPLRYKLPAYVIDLLAFGGAAGAVAKAGNAIQIAKGLSLSEAVGSVVNKIPTRFLKELTKATGLGTVLASAEYSSHYDVSVDDAIATMGFCTAVGTAFPFAKDGGKLVKEWLTKMTDTKLGLTIKKDLAKGVEWMKSKNIMTRTHPYQMQNSSIGKIRAMAARLFDFKEDGINGLDAYENIVKSANSQYSKDFAEIRETLRKINKEVREVTQKPSRQWFTEAYYGGEEVLPLELPHRDSIVRALNIVNKDIEELDILRQKVYGEIPELERSFLPAKETGENFGLKEIVERVSSGNKGSKPRYLPRKWDIKRIRENKEEFKELLKQGLINVKAGHLSEEKNLTLKNLKKYAESDELKDLVNEQYLSLTAEGGGTVSHRDEVLRRFVRVDDQAMVKYFRQDGIDGLLNWLRATRTELEFERTIKECGYKDWNEFIEDAAKDFDKKVLRLSGEEETALQKEKAYTMKMLKDMETIAKFRYRPSNSLLPNIANDVASSMANMMYACILGPTGLNSLADIGSIVLRCGLGPAVKTLVGQIGDSMKNAMRHMSKLAPTEKRQILDALRFGIEEMKVNTTIKFNPVGNDELFYGCSEASFGQKFQYGIRKVADYVNVASIMRYWDGVSKRTAAWLKLQELAEHPEILNLTKEQIQNMIKEKDFPEIVHRYINREVRKLTTVPGLVDTPNYAYNALGKFLYSLQSWTFANASNFLYPLLKGAFTKRRVAESVFTIVSMEVINVYIKSLLNGESLDFSKDEDVEKFTKNVLNRSLDQVGGTIALFAGELKDVFSSVTQKGSLGSVIDNNAPMLSFYGRLGKNTAKVIAHAINLNNNPLRYWNVRGAMSIIPGQNIPGIKGMLDIAAEGISGERKPR